MMLKIGMNELVMDTISENVRYDPLQYQHNDLYRDRVYTEEEPAQLILYNDATQRRPYEG